MMFYTSDRARIARDERGQSGWRRRNAVLRRARSNGTESRLVVHDPNETPGQRWRSRNDHTLMLPQRAGASSYHFQQQV
jgi:hypothetical protein